MLLSDFKDKNQIFQFTHNYEELELNIPGRIIRIEEGEFYKVRPDLLTICSDVETISQRYNKLFFQNNITNNLHSDLKKLLLNDPKRIVFLDIETTGFSNTPLFLIGLLYFDGSQLNIEQLFARHYSEEINLLTYFSEFIPSFKVMVTFNGKTFDIPFIKNRMIYHRKFIKRIPIHIDILYHSRRRWRGKTPDCKLQTLEYYVCGRQRIDDIPSALVPEVYREFVHTGKTEFLKNVFYHNALDLITLCELTITLISEDES